MSSNSAPDSGGGLLRALRGPRSLAWRLTAWYTLFTFAIVALSTALLYIKLVRAFEREADEFLRDNLSVLRTILTEYGEEDEHLRREVEEEMSARQYAKIYVRVLDSKGQILNETPGMPVFLSVAAFPEAEPIGAPALGAEVLSAEGAHFRMLSATFDLGRPGDSTRIVQIACDRQRQIGLLQRYRNFAWTLLTIVFLVSACVAYLLAHRGIRPIRQIIEATRHVSSRTLDERLKAERWPLEILVLAKTFNEMLDRLDDSFRRLSQFSANIAHELRTPVNNLRGELEVALGKARPVEEYQEVLGSALEECVRLSRLVDQLLFIARTENAQTVVEFKRVDVASELAVVREFYEAAAAEAGVKLSIVCPAELHAEVNRDLFQCAVGNVVGNAIAHTPQYGQVLLSGQLDNGVLKVEVSDTGCGIAPEHLSHVFDRFYRANGEKPKKGFGLGLAIVRSVLKLHQGTVDLSSTPDQGTRVTMRFPLQRPIPPAAVPEKVRA